MCSAIGIRAGTHGPASNPSACHLVESAQTQFQLVPKEQRLSFHVARGGALILHQSHHGQVHRFPVTVSTRESVRRMQGLVC